MKFLRMLLGQHLYAVIFTLVQTNGVLISQMNLLVYAKSASQAVSKADKQFPEYTLNNCELRISTERVN